MNRITVFGSNGAIGSALVLLLSKKFPSATIYSVSRHINDYSHKNIQHFCVDYFDEAQLNIISDKISEAGPLDLVVVTNGILHDEIIQPEKALKDITAEKLAHCFKINTILPSLIAKHFVPILNNKTTSIFAAFSARVGSISDNSLGGWYGYRASKAALNMIIRTASIEAKRLNKFAIIVGLHPGTVASNLSKPFRNNIPPEQVLLPNKSAEYLLSVLSTLSFKDSGKCFALDGEEILP